MPSKVGESALSFLADAIEAIARYQGGDSGGEIGKTVGAKIVDVATNALQDAHPAVQHAVDLGAKVVTILDKTTDLNQIEKAMAGGTIATAKIVYEAATGGLDDSPKSMGPPGATITPQDKPPASATPKSSKENAQAAPQDKPPASVTPKSSKENAQAAPPGGGRGQPPVPKPAQKNKEKRAAKAAHPGGAGEAPKPKEKSPAPEKKPADPKPKAKTNTKQSTEQKPKAQKSKL